MLRLWRFQWVRKAKWPLMLAFSVYVRTYTLSPSPRILVTSFIQVEIRDLKKKSQTPEQQKNPQNRKHRENLGQAHVSWKTSSSQTTPLHNKEGKQVGCASRVGMEYVQTIQVYHYIPCETNS